MPCRERLPTKSTTSAFYADTPETPPLLSRAGRPAPSPPQDERVRRRERDAPRRAGGAPRLQGGGRRRLVLGRRQPAHTHPLESRAQHGGARGADGGLLRRTDQRKLPRQLDESALDR